MRHPEEASAGRGHLNLGLAFRKRGYLSDALREYRLALESGEDRQGALQGLAEVHLLRRDFLPALELYDQLIAEQPGHAGLWTDRGVCLHLAGRRDEAKQAWATAVDLDPSHPLAWNNLGVARAHDPDPTPAASAFEAATRSRENLVPAWLNLGLLRTQRRQFRPALDAFRAVLRRHPDHALAWNGVGLVLMELQQHQEALNAFARAVESDETLAVGHYNLGFCLSHLGRFDEALRSTKRALELDAYYVPQRYVLAVDLQFEESLIPVEIVLSADVQLADLGEAFAFDPGSLDRVFAELAPDELPAPPVGATDPLALARDYLHKGMLESAAAEAVRAVRRGAPAAEGATLHGEVFARQGLHGEALERFREVLAIQPNHLAARAGDAEALGARGRGEDAVQAADRLVATAPGSAMSYAIRARARRLIGDLEGARLDAFEANRRQPGDPALMLLIGSIARAQDDLETALEAFRSALQLDEGLVQGWYEVGRIEESLGRVEPALEAYWTAVRLLPTHFEATHSLAWLLRRQGNANEAIRVLVDFLLAEPT
ncbi:MAG: tetratricopeptide repeat protein, partial [Gemmatimonadota bacterium]